MGARKRKVAFDVQTGASPLGKLTLGSMHGVLRFAAHTPSWQLIANGEPLWQRGRFSRYEELPGLGVGGLITYTYTRQKDWGIFQRLKDEGIKIVMIGGCLPLRSGFPCVLEDHAGAGALAGEHFIAQGHRHFAFVGSLGSAHVNMRFDAFRAVVGRTGAACHWFDDLTAKSGETRPDESAPSFPSLPDVTGDVAPSVLAWLKRLPLPVAVMANTDRQAQWVVAACEEAGLQIPSQVALLGVRNNLLVSESVRSSLSSIDMNAEQIGFEAARLLDRLMSGEPESDAPARIVPRGVLARGSSDFLAMEDAVLRKALRFMADRYHTPISLEDICRAAGVSHTTLEARFHRFLGRTVSAELLRLRLERAKRLMIENDLSLAQIARLTGFRLSYFHNAFAMSEGVGPGVWRRQRSASARALQ